MTSVKVKWNSERYWIPLSVCIIQWYIFLNRFWQQTCTKTDQPLNMRFSDSGGLKTYNSIKHSISKPRGGQVGWALSSGLEGPGSRLAWQITTMYANGTWCMLNPSWVQYPPSSRSNYTSGGTKVGEPSPPWKIKIVMPCLRIILRNESQTVINSPLHSSSPPLNLSNQLTNQPYRSNFFFCNY